MCPESEAAAFTSTFAKHPVHLQEVCMNLAQVTNLTVKSAIDM